MAVNNEALAVCWGAVRSGGTSSDWTELDEVDRETIFSVTLQPVTATTQHKHIRVFFRMLQFWVNSLGSRRLMALFVATGLVASIFEDNTDCTPQNIRSI